MRQPFRRSALGTKRNDAVMLNYLGTTPVVTHKLLMKGHAYV